jgi:enamine deaminase RidA (YjgF/YER057c/UK114 family)
MSDTATNDDTRARRDVLRGAMLAATGGLFLGTTIQAEDAAPGGAQRQALHPDGAPAADVGYSPAILASGQRLLFISGQGSVDVKADMETQIRQTFDRIGILLKAAGASFANVVIVRSYWVHLKRDLPIFRKVRLDYLVKPYPASTAVGTTELAIDGLELEIEVVAVV